MHFPDHPEFTPNLTPRDIFQLGSFGGSYFRPILSRCTDEVRPLKQQYLEFPDEWWAEIPDEQICAPEYNKEINKYGVKVGTDLEYWEGKGWIDPQDPYGWVQWYCRFFMGRRTKDDARQIARWRGVAGPKGRFKNQLIRRIRENGQTTDDGSVSPKISQTLQHWAYRITKDDIRPTTSG